MNELKELEKYLETIKYKNPYKLTMIFGKKVVVNLLL